jgi:predicted DNA-binding protein with PD1-like motif
MAHSDQAENAVKVFYEHFEIVSLVGTLSSTGGHHLHISLSNKDGNVLGGHVFGETNDFTTAEVVIGECVDLKFDRDYDSQSGYDELVVKQRDTSLAS